MAFNVALAKHPAVRRVSLSNDGGYIYAARAIAYNIGNDAAIMKIVGSVNVACGFHGGDAGVPGVHV